MRTLGRIFLLIALILPVWAVSAHGDIIFDVVQKCGHFEDDVVFTPGLTNTPTDQTISAHGRIYQCNKAGGSGTFNASFTLKGATCDTLANLDMSGPAVMAWVNGKVSGVSALRLQIQAVTPNKAAVTGRVDAGDLFVGLLVESQVRLTKVFKGTGAPCSPTNPMRKLDFTNSRSLRIGTGAPTTTTLPPRPTTTITFPPFPSTTAPTVTTGGNTTTTKPAVIIVPVTQGGGGGTTTTGPTTGVGGLAVTGGGTGALIGIELALLGAALWCLGGRRNRRLGSGAHQPKSFLYVTLPASAPPGLGSAGAEG
jgi:hypothetical protein